MTRTYGMLLVAGLSAAAASAAVWQTWAGAPAAARADDAADPPRFGEDRGGAKEAAVIPFDGERAMKYLKTLCDLGPRISGSEGMLKQQELVTKHFEAHGATVAKQEFKIRQKSRRAETAMTNIIATWYPDRPKRVILCAHYDTRPIADQEKNPANWAKPFASANDGTSGVALLMEMAQHMKTLPTTVGVDFVLFDGEEFIYDPGPSFGEGDRYFLGSEHFAAEYKKNKASLKYTYEAAVLFDLFAGTGARLAVEGHSWQLAPRLVEQVWKTAEKVGAKSFKYERGFRRNPDVLDDHMALNNVGIPAVDVIDFDYPDWHQLSDTPDKCSAAQFAEVGKVMAAWLGVVK